MITLAGTKKADTLGPWFFAEAAHITGKGGADVLSGGTASDYLDGGKGKDILIGGAGPDTLVGGKGADIFAVSDGDLIVDFQQGKDKIIMDQAFEKLYRDGSGGIYADFQGNADLGNPADLIVSTPGILLNDSDFLNL